LPELKRRHTFCRFVIIKRWGSNEQKKKEKTVR
jgi:hypothetical protein